MSAKFITEIATLKSKTAGTGRFGRLFPGLPAQGAGVDPGTIQGWLTSLGTALIDDVDANGILFPAGDHTALPAGYTYLGQLIDHDLTFDPTSLPTTQVDISTLNNFRSAAFDLDSLLGFGPGATPLLYEAQSSALAGRLRTATSMAGNPGVVANDLPRLGDGTPLIGDPRNDENLLVGQLHTALITFFNKVFVELAAGTIPDLGPDGGSTSEKAARIVRWHYQWIVLNDFLPRIVEGPILAYIVANGPQHYQPVAGDPYMPVEFAGAAYRLGHSMVREQYHVNRNFAVATLGDLFNFSSSGGSVPVPAIWFINWNRLFEIDPNTAVNRARRLDPYASPTLHHLPPGVPPPRDLAVRNLLRGWSWSLPSGQAIAGALGVVALTPAQILADAGGQLCKEAPVVEPFNFHVDTPLWYYILKESEALHAGERLGSVGSTILAEVVVGLLRADPESFQNVNPGWTPTLPSTTPGQFTMADLFRYLPPEALNPNGGDVGAV